MNSLQNGLVKCNFCIWNEQAFVALNLELSKAFTIGTNFPEDISFFVSHHLLFSKNMQRYKNYFALTALLPKLKNTAKYMTLTLR